MLCIYRAKATGEFKAGAKMKPLLIDRSYISSTNLSLSNGPKTWYRNINNAKIIVVMCQCLDYSISHVHLYVG